MVKLLFRAIHTRILLINKMDEILLHEIIYVGIGLYNLVRFNLTLNDIGTNT